MNCKPVPHLARTAGHGRLARLHCTLIAAGALNSVRATSMTDKAQCCPTPATLAEAVLASG